MKALAAAGLGLCLGGCLLAERFAAGGSASETTNKIAGKRDSADPPGGTTPVTAPPLGPDAAEARTWRLNTTAAGAAVAEDQVGFPLLLRLDSASCDFSRAGNGGSGIGFRKGDGTPLPFAIERWDSLGRKAEIWVRMDTVKGNSDTQIIRMEIAPGPSGPFPPGPGVFSPADGFAGVWHLGAAEGGKPDATGNGHWAHPVYSHGRDTVEGRVGLADRLDTLNGYLDVGVVQAEGTLTLSAWVLADAGSPWSAVIQKPLLAAGDGTSADPWQMSYGLLSQGAGEGQAFAASPGTLHPVLMAATPAAPGAWIHLAGTWDGESFTLFRDGRKVAAGIAGFAGYLERNDLPTWIGGYSLPNSQQRYGRFSGLVDEVRIEATARSEGWIRLAYENQKAGQSLLRLIR